MDANRNPGNPPAERDIVTATDSTLDSLTRAVLERPHDMLARLVLADRLEEGTPEQEVAYVRTTQLAFPVVPDWLPVTSQWQFHQMRLGPWIMHGFLFHYTSENLYWSYSGSRSRFLRRLHRDLAVAYATRYLAACGEDVPSWGNHRWADAITDRKTAVSMARAATHIAHDRIYQESTAQARLLTLGIPRPWDRRWATRDACSLARAAHSNWDFTAMPILADMLEDAGCDDADMLRWCRELPPHCWYRGAWVVERLRTTQWRTR